MLIRLHAQTPTLDSSTSSTGEKIVPPLPRSAQDLTDDPPPFDSGFSGFTTRDVLPVAKDFLSKETDDKRIEINFTTLFLGANDACLFGDQCVRLSPM
jgi:hypothetical protein